MVDCQYFNSVFQFLNLNAFIKNKQGGLSNILYLVNNFDSYFNQLTLCAKVSLDFCEKLLTFAEIEMNELASQIFEIIKDYRNHDGFFLTEQDIINWGNQFGDENVFVLTELLEILPKVYISRKRAKDYIRKHIFRYLNKYRYSSVASFLCETEFLIMQKPHKSQPAILELLEEVLNEDYQESYKNYLSYPKINYIYFDDILASGSTIGRDVVKWLKEKDQYSKSNQEKLILLPRFRSSD